MANPRQRRKLRSGTHRSVSHSRRAKTLLKKQPPIKGPKILQDAWDKHKTVRQNYEALGLAASLAPTASGGMERRHHLQEPLSNASTLEVSTSENSVAGQTQTAIPKGYGRIIRDENGNAVDIELADDETDPQETLEHKLVEDIPDPAQQEDLAGWVALGNDPSRKAETTGTVVVQKLEELQTSSKPVPRFTSSAEAKILKNLVVKYGEDVDAMARDRRLNADQRTAGELRRAIRKAGGFAAIKKVD
ncbi:hypothetical protein QCA50_002898 [Cerrena zonata]|uniref:Nucleolar protein 16 n=1 Tax=Cerrena zonata TaxID=2478898 RepID=A0AAW0GJ37_9APHY